MLHLQRKKACFVRRKDSSLRTGSFLLFGLVLFANTANAQPRDWNLFDHDTKPYYFGITLSTGLTRFQTALHPRFLQDDSVMVAEPGNSAGFGLGLSATMRLSDRFQLRFNPQLMFTSRNILYTLKYPDIDGLTKVDKPIESVTVSFPFQVKLQSDRIGNFRVY